MELREVPQPQPKAGAVLVRVRYAGLNRRDLTRTPGDEGTVPGMDPAARALTMHDALIGNGRLQRGESVLIQGASSGVGLMGLQIAKLMGARF